MNVKGDNRNSDSALPDDGGMSRLGDRIRQLRVGKHLSIAALARQIGIAQPSLWEIENGETKTLKADTLMRLAAALGADPEYIRTGRHTPPPSVAQGDAEQQIIDMWQEMDADTRVTWRRVGEALLAESGKAQSLLQGTSSDNESSRPRRTDSRQRVAQALLDELAEILAAYGPDALAGAFAHLQEQAKGPQSAPAPRSKAKHKA